VHRSLPIRLLLIAGLALPATIVLSAAPASAAAKSCSISHNTTVSPGLEQPPTGDAADAVQTFKVAATLSGCTGAPGVTTGTAAGTLKSTSPSKPTCADLAVPGSKAAGTVTVKWNNGKTSNATLTVTVDAPQHGKLSGKVTGGLFKGGTLGGASSFNIATGNCSDATPVTKLSGSGTITLS
jgi:hypothetical protein